jgi:hypothetical protein
VLSYVKIQEKEDTHKRGELRNVFFRLLLALVLLIIQGCGGGGSVRRRNTLHVVGGRQYIVTSAVYGERDFIL